ncbi:MAG: hypothetical protein AB1635_19980 [Acidobacteriota bacterium]
MDEWNARREPERPLVEDLTDDEAADLVGRTGEEMPIAEHDQGHRDFRPAAPPEEFDPRISTRRSSN